MAKTLYLIDGHYQIYRAFYGLTQPLSSPTGEPTAATHVFCSMLFSLLRGRRPDYLAMVMDVSDETVFRRDLDANYKAHRDATPDGLSVQADRIVSIVEGLGIPLFRVPGFEADDILATIAEKLRGVDVDVYMVSRDKDLDQVLTDRVRLYDPVKDQVVDPQTLLATKGYGPEKAVEIQTLVGDSTDNIPGVAGVGPKTAAKLIGQYGTAQAVIEHADELTPKLREKVLEFAGQIECTRKLVTLRRDVPVEFDLAACAVSRLRPAAVRPIFKELGMSRTADLLDTLAADLKIDVEAGAAPSGMLFSEPQAAEAAALNLPAALAVPGTYHLIDTDEQLEQFAAELAAQTSFVFDTETTGICPVDAKLVGISFAWQPGEAYYVPVLAAVGRVLPVAKVVERLRLTFADPGIAKAGHNLKYDIVVLRQIGIEVGGADFDTLIASFVLDPARRSHGLDALAKGLLGLDMIPITDLIGKGKNQITMEEVDPARICEYSGCDADYTLRLRELLRPQVEASPVASLFRETEMPLVEVLAEMEHNGVALDSALLRKIGEGMSDRILELKRRVQEEAGCNFNPDSPRQLATVLFDNLGFSVVRNTKTGRSTDAETLEAIAEQTEHPVPRLILEYRELTKLKNTYVDTLPTMICRRTGRVHASFHQTGAITGRLSSSDPNLQNIPIRTETGRQIRQAFVAGSADHVLLAADYSQIELRVLAHFSEDAALMEAFASGQDIHRAVAAQVNGVTIEQVTPAQRSAAKAVNFGIIYGQTPYGLSRSLGISVSDAKTFIENYFLRYPGIRRFIDQCIADARRTGYAETILGRRRPIPELASRNRGQMAFGERIAVNTVIQGSAADLIKRAMIDIHRAIRTGKHTSRMLLQVHDELVFEVPNADLERESRMIREKMENPLALRVPLVADICWGRTWADAK